ncbi:MAG: ParA family protein [Gammaproteobacteria bacterium]|nr:ParA family protein [Gammaproteobacteria bacterium]
MTENLRRIVVMNSKGGCGKTTIATNLASCYASHGFRTALFDYDPQGSSMRWLRSRDENLPDIYGVVAHKSARDNKTQSWHLRLPIGTERVIIDTPAGLRETELLNHIHNIDEIVIPVLPSPIDIHSTADFIRDLLLIGKLRASNTRVNIITNRVKANTIAFQALKRFLDTLKIPVIAQIKDTQNYVHAAERGMGIHEIAKKQLEEDKILWDQILKQLEATAS